MEADKYQELAIRTANRLASPKVELTNYGLGLNGEAGEVADIIKKAVFHEHKFKKEDLINELSDCLWYIAAMCDCIEVKMSDVMKHNLEKLAKRYPVGFLPEHSINRDED